MKILAISILLTISSLTTYSQCLITQLDIFISACNSSTNDYTVTGDVDFINAPATGQLIVIDVFSGAFEAFNAPFTGPVLFTIPGLNSNAQLSTIEAYFTVNTACDITINYNAPPSCGCNSFAGTVSGNIIGNGINSYILCDGDEINVFSNNDYVLPISIGPGIGYLLYDCAPDALNNDPMGDACMFSPFSGMSSFTDPNIGGASNGTLGAVINSGGYAPNNTLWFVPITYTDNLSNSYDPNCVDLGPPIEVVYLNPISIDEVIDSINGTVTVIVSGGYSEFYSGQYHVSNNGAGTISSATVDSSGGSFQISGLTGGSIWDYTVLDDNGCNVFSSGSLPGSLEINERVLDYSLSPNPSTEFININFQRNIKGTASVVNQLGEIIYKVDVTGNTVQLNVQNLDSGVYFITVESNRNSYPAKRVIKID